MSRHIFGPLVLANQTVLTVGPNYQLANESSLVVKKATPGPSTITLPVNPFQGQEVYIKDGLRDAGTNNITILPDGVAATTIDGAASYVMSDNGGSATFAFNGTEWNLVGKTGAVGNPGSAGSKQTITKAITGMADATDVALFTITVPNAIVGAQIAVFLHGTLGDGDSTDSALYNIGVSRVPGAAAKAVASTKSVVGATAGATANAVVIITVPAVAGAVGVVNTFAVTARVTRSAGVAVGHFVTAEVQCLNGGAGGVTIS